MRRNRLFKKFFSNPLRVRKQRPWRPTTRSVIHRSRKVYSRKKKHKHVDRDEW